MSNNDVNKMVAKNIATCFGPTLLKPPSLAEDTGLDMVSDKECNILTYTLVLVGMVHHNTLRSFGVACVACVACVYTFLCGV